MLEAAVDHSLPLKNSPDSGPNMSGCLTRRRLTRCLTRHHLTRCLTGHLQYVRMSQKLDPVPPI